MCRHRSLWTSNSPTAQLSTCTTTCTRLLLRRGGLPNAMHAFGLLQRHPTSASRIPDLEQPSYSNIAFAILGYALENITSEPISHLLQSKIFDPLHLTSTFSALPPSSLLPCAIIPPGSWSWYTTDLKSYTAVGAIYSTINDLHQFSISILNSILLNPTTTRRWLKLQAFTSNPNVAISVPWEISRAPTARTSYL